MRSARVAAIAAGSVAITALAQAATWNVPEIYPTVGAALAVAAAGDTVLIAPGRYAERGLTVPGGITLRGDSSPAGEAWFDGLDAAVPVLTIPPDAARVRIEDLTFRNARPALVVSAGPARHEVRRCTFRENAGAVAGTGIDVRECVFEHNTAPSISAKDVVVEACTFRSNSSREPGAGVSMIYGSVRRCRFEGNEAVGGGAIHSECGEIRDCTFVGNVAIDDTHGGAVHLTGPTPVSGCLFLRNRAGGDGGALYAQDRTTAVDHCRFLGNTATRGGAVLVAGAHLTVRYCTFLRNAALKGGAILAPTTSHRTLALENTVIQETLSGGHIVFTPAALTPTLVSCNLFGNAGGDWVDRFADQYPGSGNLALDSRFCTGPEDSLFVDAASPLLAANNRDGVDIGASRAGCHAPGILITSAPPGVPLEVDGVVHGAPTVFPWTAGSPHTLAAPVQFHPCEGTRLDFVAWSDGGAVAHTIVAPAEDAEIVARYARSFRVTTGADTGGSIEPASGWVPEGSALAIRAIADSGAVFAGWTGTGTGSYTGPLPVVNLELQGPVAQHAHFYRPPPGGTFSLTMTGLDGAGVIWPPSGPHAPGDAVEISAVALSGFRFVKWVGEGQDSYSGEEPRATVVFHSDVTQHAVFVPDGSLHGAEFSLSASATDPYRNVDTPAGGPRPLYLWLVCSQGGISAIECGVTSTLPLGGFVPAEGVINFGIGTDLVLVVDRCPVGDPVHRLLGEWTAADTGGRVCLAPSRQHRVFATVDCGILPNQWPDPFVRGFSSDGEPPCALGSNGCGAPVTGTGAPLVAAPRVTGLTGVAPSPFRGRTEVHFSLARGGVAKVTLYDVTGRLVRVLRDGEMPPGAHVVPWDGRAGSARAAAGIYFVRFEAAGTRQTERVVFLGD